MGDAMNDDVMNDVMGGGVMGGGVMGGASVTPQPVDPHLNIPTRALFRSLHQASGTFAMFGHQNETSNVIGTNTDSDVHAVTGTYPALWGSDLSGVERDETTNIDGFSMSDVRAELLRAYSMGAVTTMSWHSANPITFGGYGHNTAPGSVAAVLPGGARHGQFLEWLDRVAAFLDSVVDEASGESVPIIFRPFHEHTGDWFWWCTGSPAQPTDTTPEQFIALWRMTVDYLRDVRGLHNVLYAYSPDRSRIDMSSESTCEAGYLYAYPGDDYVDVLGFDDYWDIAPADVEAEQPHERHDDLITMLTVVGRLARERGKIAAATEVGSPGEFASRYVMSAEDKAALSDADCGAADGDGCCADSDGDVTGRDSCATSDSDCCGSGADGAGATDGAGCDAGMAAVCAAELSEPIAATGPTGLPESGSLPGQTESTCPAEPSRLSEPSEPFGMSGLSELAEPAESSDPVEPSDLSESSDLSDLSDVQSESDSPWTHYLLTAALANSDTRRVLWYMPWRNDPGAAGTGAYGTPVAGSKYAADFRRFTEHPFIRMANTLPPLY